MIKDDQIFNRRKLSFSLNIRDKSKYLLIFSTQQNYYSEHIGCNV